MKLRFKDVDSLRVCDECKNVFMIREIEIDETRCMRCISDIYDIQEQSGD